MGDQAFDFNDPDFFTSLMQQFSAGGMDTSTLSSIWGSSLDVDYPVQVEVRKTSRNLGPRGYLQGGASQAQAEAFRMRAAGEEEVPVTAGELLKEFTSRSRQDPEGFLDLQQRLFMGGFYNSNVSMEDIQFGTLDETTLDAFFSVLQWTGRYNEAGENLTWEEVLNERSASMLGPLREQLLRSRGGGGGGATVRLADPAGLAQALDSVAQQTVGRKATPDEQRMFVATFHSMQRSSAGGGVTPDVSGQAEAMLREQAPVEAQSHDVARVFDDFLSIIGGMGTT